ncbi:MAG: hypothetical protein OXH57_09600 [Ekhidna sp.]|nr:hypothetical protein [Ekhidna sp.]
MDAAKPTRTKTIIYKGEAPTIGNLLDLQATVEHLKKNHAIDG